MRIYFFRFPSKGISFRSLSFSARIARITIAIMYETCDGIWNRLVKRHMHFITENMLQEIADEFETQWNFPNCVAAIDGKRAYQVLTKLSFVIINPTSPYTFKQ